MSAIDDLIDQANGLDTWAQYALGFGLTVLSLLVVRFLMKKVILDFVKATSFKWDDALYRPVTQRLYLFILFVGVQLTLLWIRGEEEDLNVALDPLFSAAYILLTTSVGSNSVHASRRTRWKRKKNSASASVPAVQTL